MFSVSMLIFISVLCLLLSYIFIFLLVNYTELHLRLVYCRGTCTYFEGHRGTQEVELLVQLLTFYKIQFVLFCNQFRNVLISQRHLSVRTQLFLQFTIYQQKNTQDFPKTFYRYSTLGKLKSAIAY